MSSGLALPIPAWKSDALSLYQRLLPASFLDPLEKKYKRQHHRVYTSLVVMWLLIVQRLQPLASLETAVLELLRGLPSSFCPSLANVYKTGGTAGNRCPVTPGLIIRRGRRCRSPWWNKAAIGSSNS